MRKYIRFVNGLRNFIKTRMTPDEAIQSARMLLQARIAAREENFLNLAEKGIFRYPKSPYLKLLDARRIRFEDLKSWVEQRGIEESLRILQAEGVFFTVDEFKGKTPVVRNGIQWWCQESMFDNPFLSSAYEVRSGATRSAGTRIRIDFEYLHQRSLYDAFLLNIHGCLNSPIANWFPVFPGAPGINSSMRFGHIGNRAQCWFSQVDEDNIQVNAEKKWGTRLIFAVHRLYGYPLAEPVYASLNDAHKVACWAARVLTEHPSCVVYTFAASAVRICIAAAEANLSLKGTKFLVTGEPLTPQKKREIESAGARAIPVYGISEAGVIAAGCDKENSASDHCHLYKDTIALITHKHTVTHSDLTIESFLFTSLLYESPKLLLNVGMGDYGDIAPSKCGCEFAKTGFDTSISGIRSYEKLTGEGVTFVDTDLIRIIEKELPEKFGGRSTDYQIVEREDARGLPQLQLMVSPRIKSLNEKEVLSQFMLLLKNSEDSPESWAQSGTEMWKQAKMVGVKRDSPIPTASGKILPFYVVKTVKRATETSRETQEVH